MVDAPRHFRIFISSPGDVAEEREIALKLIEDLPYDPSLRGRVTLEAVAWDKKGAPLLATITPQEAVNQGLPLPSECDIVIVIFWSKMGTPLPFPEYRKEKGDPYHSGTDWEYEDAYKSAKATGFPFVIVYRRTEVPSFLPTDPDFLKKYEQWQKVQTFFSSFSEAETGAGLGGYNSYLKAENFKDLLDTHLKNVLERLLKSPPRPSVTPKVETKTEELPPKWQGSPFPGLRAFTTSDAPIYFGRGNESEKLMRRVAERGFVAVVGASGSGKSSLVGAGLIPRLKAGGLEGSEHWLLPEFKDGQWNGFRFTPGEVGSNPFMALAAKCAALHGMRNPQFAEKLEADPQVLVRLCLKALEGKPDAAKVLIFIDQFEELFTVVDAKYREPFINLLDAAATEERLRVVVTTRSDFYDRCLEWQLLTTLLENGQYPVSTPDAFFLKDMIEKPAKRAGLTFEEGLPARMVSDTGSDAGALALLAFALDELYKAADQDQTLTHAAYEKLGEVEGAIGTRAAAIYSDLKPEVQGALAEVFGKLVTVNVEGTPTRRRALLADFDEEGNARQLIHALADARLLVTDGKTLEVAHEALFRKWPTLIDWIAEYKNDLFVIEQVKQAAKIWYENGQNYKSYGWNHDRLKPVYKAQERLNVQFDMMTYLFTRPEAERLLEQFRNAPQHKRRTLIEEDFARLGEDGLEELLFALDLVSKRILKSGMQTTADRIFQQHHLSATRLFIKHLVGRNKNLQELVLEGLVKLNAREAIPHITALLSNMSMRKIALDALIALNAREAAPSIVPLLSDEKMQGFALEALIKLNAKEVIPHLIAALSDVNEHVRLSAVYVLGNLNAQEAIPFIIPLLSDKEVKLAALNALSSLNAQEAVPAIVPLLSDERTQQKAIEVLVKLNAKEVIPTILELLLERNPFKRIRISTLVAVNIKRLLPNIMQLLSEEDIKTQQLVATALEQIGTPEALAAVAEWRAKQSPAD